MDLLINKVKFWLANTNAPELLSTKLCSAMVSSDDLTYISLTPSLRQSVPENNIGRHAYLKSRVDFLVN